MKNCARALMLMSLLIGYCLANAEPSRPVPPMGPPPPVVLSSSREARVALPWTEDFETGAAGWTFSGFFNVVANAQQHEVMSPTIHPNLVTLPDAGTLPAAHGGNHSLWYGELSTGTFIGADFDHNQPSLSGGTSTAANSGSAITPDLDLTNCTDATLTFWTVWEVEGVDIPWYDVMYIEASTDGGATWSAVGSGQLNPLNDVNANPNVGYSSGGLGMPPTWVQHSMSLAPFCGSICWVRFRFETWDQLYNGFRGWFIDDIAVDGGGTPTGPTITDVVPGVGMVGDIISVIGTGFQSGATIDLDGIPCESAVLSNVLAQFYVPDVPDGGYAVILSNPDGQFAMCSGCFEVTLIEGPSIAFVDPDWAYPGIATPLIIEGQNFDPDAVVTIAGIPALDVVWVTLERIECVSPPTLGIGYHAVRVVNPDGRFDQCTGCFQVKKPEPATNLVISISGQDAILNWSPSVMAGAEYRIFRDTDPEGLFSLMVGDVPDTFFVDNNAIQDLGPEQFYIVRAYIP